jgi:hypothetical protein
MNNAATRNGVAKKTSYATESRREMSRGKAFRHAPRTYINGKRKVRGKKNFKLVVDISFVNHNNYKS